MHVLGRGAISRAGSDALPSKPVESVRNLAGPFSRRERRRFDRNTDFRNVDRAEPNCIVDSWRGQRASIKPDRQTGIATGAYEEFQWDHHNRLVRITTVDAGGTVLKQVDYTYDVFGQRLAKRIDSDGDGSADRVEKYVYDGLRPERGAAGDHIALVFVDPDGDGPAGDQLQQRMLYGPAVDQILAVEQIAPGERHA